MSETNTKSSKNRPVHEIRIGAIKAVIWANKVSNGTMHNVNLVRIYRDDEGNWHDTDSLGRDDLLVAAKVADMAHTWILETEHK